jgi:hypothetical protein
VGVVGCLDQCGEVVPTQKGVLGYDATALIFDLKVDPHDSIGIVLGPISHSLGKF